MFKNFKIRPITAIFAVLLILIQYPLWFGKGGWLRVYFLQKQLNEVTKKNETLQLRNAQLASEVQSLKDGTEAIEERARNELSMIKKDEIFIQLLDHAPEKTANTTQSTATPN